MTAENDYGDGSKNDDGDGAENNDGDRADSTRLETPWDRNVNAVGEPQQAVTCCCHQSSRCQFVWKP